jgi:transcriptional regulator with XRE-family HTH domain
LKEVALLDIGDKVKDLRLRLGLTQEELAARTELSKGFISQLERNITSPSIVTLMDVLEALGTDISSFFREEQADKIVCGPEDMFEKTWPDGGVIRWLVTGAQKNALEPILVQLPVGVATPPDDPHEGEEFGYVLAGAVTLMYGDQKYRVKRGGSFYFQPRRGHYLLNAGKIEARILWVSTPPSF